MASMISEMANPFMKDYSGISLLKQNYGVLQLNSQIKQAKSQFKQQYQHQKQNVRTQSTISNPFKKQTLNCLKSSRQKLNFSDSYSSQIRNSLQTRKPIYLSLEKNTFYKGLQDIGTKQLWKQQLQKQTRFQLKNYGAQTLRYEYKGFQMYENKEFQKYPQKIQTHSKQTPSFNDKVASQYYGYTNNARDEDDFPIQRATQKKSSLKKYQSSANQKSKLAKHSYFQDIPEDKDQDIGTMRNLQKENLLSEQPDGCSQSLNNFFAQKRNSVEIVKNAYQPESSASSGFGSPSQMYESGANFGAKFNLNKKGPLNSSAFDDDDKQSDAYGKQSVSDSKNGFFSNTLQYNNKDYFKISI